MKDSDSINVQMHCSFCNSEHSVIVKTADYEAWKAGELAQNAFPYLSSDKREQLISRLCQACINDVFGWEE